MLIVLVMTLNSVVLSVLIDVGGCRWPITISAYLIWIVLVDFKKNNPNFDSAADGILDLIRGHNGKLDHLILDCDGLRDRNIRVFYSWLLIRRGMMHHCLYEESLYWLYTVECALDVSLNNRVGGFFTFGGFCWCWLLYPSGI